MNKTIQILKDRQDELSSRDRSGEEHEEMLYLGSVISNAIRFQCEREEAAHIEKAKLYLSEIGIKVECHLQDGSNVIITHNDEVILDIEDTNL